MNPTREAVPVFPKDRDFEGADSPAATPCQPAKRRKVVNGTSNSNLNDTTTTDRETMLLDERALDLKPTKWQSTIEQVVKAIVSIRFSQVAAFDTEGTTTTTAIQDKTLTCGIV